MILVEFVSVSADTRIHFVTKHVYTEILCCVYWATLALFPRIPLSDLFWAERVHMKYTKKYTSRLYSMKAIIVRYSDKSTKVLVCSTLSLTLPYTVIKSSQLGPCCP